MFLQKKIQLRLSSLLVAVCCYVALAASAQAQISFVQITDPHLFDDTWPEDSRREDKTAFASCINQINERVAAGTNFSFVVLTGDLGVEGLVDDLDEKHLGEADQRIQQAARELAAMLSHSKVKVWLFVPGNNDVLKEVPKNVKYYHLFMNALFNASEELARASNNAANKLTVVDLCPADSDPNSSVFSRSDFYRIGDYVFIGFNDSSFKNSKEEDEVPQKGKRAPAKLRVEENFDVQRKYVAQVAEHLKRSDLKFAYVFYHVPEIDDPYYVGLKQDAKQLQPRVDNQRLIGNSYRYSAWFVRPEIRDDWNRIVIDPRVKGLFAGHFHDRKHQSYDDYEWTLTPSYLPESFSKLHVAPPLALKFQRDEDGKVVGEQARGFQEVYLGENGTVSTRVFWLTNHGWTLSSAEANAQAQAARQFELGQFYERNQRTAEAEAAYQKAADNDWPPTQRRAREALAYTLNKRQSRYNKYIATPFIAGWSTGISALGALLPALLLVLLLILVAPLVAWFGNRRGRKKLRIGPLVGSPRAAVGASFEHLLTTIHSRMLVYYKRRPMIVGEQLLPMLTGSQGADVPELIESALPGPLGTAVTWLAKKTNKPRYALTGTIHGWRRRPELILLSVQESGRCLRTWHSYAMDAEIIQNQISMAFKSLRFIVKRMNHGRR